MDKVLKQIIADQIYGWQSGNTQHIAIDQGVITAVQNISADEAHMLLAAGDTAVLDLRGLTVLPGLIDAHVHAIATGMLLLGADLHEAATLDQVAAAARAS